MPRTQYCYVFGSGIRSDSRHVRPTRRHHQFDDLDSPHLARPVIAHLTEMANEYCFCAGIDCDVIRTGMLCYVTSLTHGPH